MDEKTILEVTRKFLPNGERPSYFEIAKLLRVGREVFMSQPMLLELEAPVKIVGDLHGQYQDLIRIFEKEGYPPEVNYLFLGDYVDRGKCGVETFCLLMCFKILYPENIFLLRGNHEVACINRIYGFYDEVKRRFNIKMWKKFTDVFNCLPICAIIGERIFCTHGGLSPDIQHQKDLYNINQTQRPTDIPDSGILCDLLWADPDRELSGWGESDRGVSYSFGPSIVEDFLRKFSFDLIVRAHQVVEYGYEFATPSRSIVTIFSATGYVDSFDNDGATMTVDASMLCSFTVYRPPWKRSKSSTVAH